MAHFDMTGWDPKKGGRLPKPYVFRMFDYEWYEEVVGAFHASDARLRIPCAPARTSKSFSAAYEVPYYAMPEWEIIRGKHVPKQTRPNDDRRIWIVGPSYNINKEFDYVYGEAVTRKKLPVIQSSYSPNQGNMRIVLEWGTDRDGIPVRTIIEGKSATNPESLQAEEIDLVILSEAAEHPEKIWSRYLSTRCHAAIFPTTPKITAQWLHGLIEMSEADDTLGIEAFQFTPRCNPLYDWTRYWNEHAQAERRRGVTTPTVPKDKKLEFGGANAHDCFDPTSGCQAMVDPWFAEQFGGRWTHEAERILPFRWDGPESHVLNELPAWWEGARYYISIDYGFTDPSAVLWWAVGRDGQVLLYREIYESKMDSQQLVDRIYEACEYYNEPIEYIVGDPNEPGIEQILRKQGLKVCTRDKRAQRDRAAGGTKLVEMLAHDPLVGTSRLHVLSEKAGDGFGCPKTIQEWKHLRRAESGGNEWSTSSVKGEDHAFDATRYFLMSHPKTAPVKTHTSRWREDHRNAVMQMERRRSWAHESRSPMAGRL